MVFEAEFYSSHPIVCVWGGGCSAVWNMTLSDDRMFVNITVDSKQELELELGGPKVLGVVF